MNHTLNTGIIILAAGNSSRLGRPKQLLTYQGKSLIDIVTNAAIQTNIKHIVVVLGAYAEQISEKQQQQGVNYIVNDSWEQGMSSSISAGLLYLRSQNKDIQQVIIAVSDQPFISKEIFKNLIKAQQETGKSIVTCRYAQTTGTPALFNKAYFDQLLSLNGNHGAKNILIAHPEDTASISFEKGDIDIDTEIDYNNLIQPA